MLSRVLLLALASFALLRTSGAGPLEEGAALADRGRFGPALAQFEEAKAANLSPIFAELGCIECLANLRRMPEAITRARALLQRHPQSSLVAANLAQLLFVDAQDAESVAVFERALKLHPQDADLRNSYAWMLAIHPDPRFRNGPRAVQLSTGLIGRTRYDQASYRDTLAAAYATAGRFPEAVRMQEMAMPDLLRSRDSTFRIRSRARERLDFFRQGKAWHRRPTIPAS